MCMDMPVKNGDTLFYKRDNSCVWTCQLKMEIRYFTRGKIHVYGHAS